MIKYRSMFELGDTMAFIDKLITPALIWVIFFAILIIGSSAVWILKYHWDKHILGAEFIKIKIMKGLFIQILSIFTIASLLIAIFFDVKF